MVFESQAPSMYTAIVLMVLGGILIVFGRRRRDAQVLAVVILLVALNFAAEVMRAFLPGDEHTIWSMVAVLALAWDPFFLLLFTRSYPYPDNGLVGRVAQSTSGVLAVLATLVVLAGPDEAMSSWHDIAGLHAIRWIVIIHLVSAYTMAWAFVLKRSVTAPTDLLRQRCAWSVLAIGIVTVPRMIQLGADLDPSGLLCLSQGRFGGCQISLGAEYLFQAGVGTIAMAVCYFAGLTPVRTAITPMRGTRRAVTVVGWVALSYLFMILLAIGLKAGLGWTFIGPRLYGLRWIVFGLVLLYGILAYEFVEVEAMRPRLIAWMSGVLGSLAIALVTYGLMSDGQDGRSAVALAGAMSVGIASSAPIFFGARKLVAAMLPPGAVVDRRFQLYRAAVEEAMSSGVSGPNLRSRLDHCRRRFGLGTAVATGIEHFVRMDLQNDDPPNLGDEVLPGLILEDRVGGGGNVFVGRRGPDERVVVKIYARGGEGRQRFLNEVRALQGFRHANAVRLLDFQVRSGWMVAVLEYVDAPTLAQRLHQGPLGEPQTHWLAKKILSALDAAHSKGLLHSDIKPSNILLRNDRVWLADFDNAVFSTRPHLEQTLSMREYGWMPMLGGTLSYMSPEQVAGQPISPATDLYSLGLVLYECLTGRRALDLKGFPESMILTRIINPDIDLNEIAPGWKKFLAKTLSTEPKDRYRSSKEMNEALRELKITRAEERAKKI